MRAILVRIGIDQASKSGGWNGPVDPSSRKFVYVPITNIDGRRHPPGWKRTYREAVPALNDFSEKFGVKELVIPSHLRWKAMHLDPDFEALTYGDDGKKRGSKIKGLSKGDLLVFYAGLRPIGSSRRLIYAIVGLYTVDCVVPAEDVPTRRRRENAHTRWSVIDSNHIVVRASSRRSGRLTRCLPIGEWRSKAYRVKPGILQAWGGLRVKNGYIQRSARPPEFRHPRTFLRWFEKQNAKFLRRNN